jgi:hypothetical protein
MRCVAAAAHVAIPRDIEALEARLVYHLWYQP